MSLSFIQKLKNKRTKRKLFKKREDRKNFLDHLKNGKPKREQIESTPGTF